jgi:hypothetical protein
VANAKAQKGHDAYMMMMMMMMMKLEKVSEISAIDIWRLIIYK